MKLTIIYASNSGSTYQTALNISDTLTELGHEVAVVDANEASAEDVTSAEVVLLGSPSWLVDGEEGKMLEAMSELIEKLTESNLEGKKMAFFGCGDDSYIKFCGAVDDLVEFGKQKKVQELVPALRINKFYFDLDQNTEMTKAWAQVLSEHLN